ncbi:membrane protein [Streptomyces phage Enygma]
MDKNEVRVALIIASVFIALFASIGFSVNYNDYLDSQTAQKCIASGKVWGEGACVDNVSDLKYIDN